MKNQILTAVAALFLGTVMAQAQAGTKSNTATTKVNLILADVISIDEGSVASGGIVDFNYNNTTDYNTAKEATVASSLVITSTRNFDVKVAAVGEKFVGKNKGEIDLDVLQIQAVNSAENTGEKKEITLTKDEQNLVADAAKGAKITYDIKYSISAKMAKTKLLQADADTYEAQVVYTAVAK